MSESFVLICDDGIEMAVSLLRLLGIKITEKMIAQDIERIREAHRCSKSLGYR